jgi:hypothetical protein
MGRAALLNPVSQHRREILRAIRTYTERHCDAESHSYANTNRDTHAYT